MDDNKDKKIGVKLICVLLSFALWLYISSIENPNKTLTVSSIPVEITNADSLQAFNLAIAPEQDFHIDLKIEGPISKIYSVSKEDFKLSVDLSNYALKKGENNIPVQVVDYPEGINIKSESVLSIKVIIEDAASKEVKIKSKVNKLFKVGYSENTSTIEPSTVKVYGPKSLVELVDSAQIVGEAIDIDKNTEEEFNVQAVDKDGNVIKGLELSQEKATLKLTVAKGKEVEIKTRYIGALPEGLTLEKEELSKSKIGISGDTNVIESIEYLELEPINLSEITQSGEVKANIIVPSGVKVSSQESYITVNLTIKDSRLTKKTIQNVHINYSSMDDKKFGYSMPSTVDIVLSGTQDDLKNITESNILVEASLNDLTAPGEYNVNWKASVKDAKNVSIDNNNGTVKVVITSN